MAKKAQAAMEFLMTYGWAILVVLVVIGALAYFGVLSPKKLLPDKCLFGPGIGTCSDFQALASGQIKLDLVNGFGETVTVTDATAKGTLCSTVTDATAPGDWASGDKKTLTFACTAASAGDKTNEEVTITYTKGATATLTHTVTGSVSIAVQPTP